MKKIYMIEVGMSHHYHTSLNAALYDVLSTAFKNRKVVLCSERLHGIEAKRKSRSLEFYNEFFKFPTVSFSTIVFRDILGCFITIKYFLKASRTDILFFTYALPLSNTLINLLSWILRREVLIMVHCEMEAFVSGSNLGKSRYLYALQKPLFKIKNRVRYVLLGQSIFVNLRHLFKSEKKVIVIDHPYNYEKSVTHRNLNQKTLSVGVIGRGTFNKGAHLIFGVADKLKLLVQDGSLKFSIIGQSDRTIDAYRNNLVKTFRDSINQQEFDSLINSLSYALFFYDRCSYKATASGAFFDAVKFLTPVITLRNDFIEGYFDKFGDIGFIVDSLDEMALLLKGISEDRTFYESRYAQQILNLKNMRSRLDISEISKKIKFS